MMNCVGGESLGGGMCCCTSFEHRCGCAKGAETELWQGESYTRQHHIRGYVVATCNISDQVISSCRSRDGNVLVQSCCTHAPSYESKRWASNVNKTALGNANDDRWLEHSMWLIGAWRCWRILKQLPQMNMSLYYIITYIEGRALASTEAADRGAKNPGRIYMESRKPWKIYAVLFLRDWSKLEVILLVPGYLLAHIYQGCSPGIGGVDSFTPYGVLEHGMRCYKHATVRVQHMRNRRSQCMVRVMVTSRTCYLW